MTEARPGEINWDGLNSARDPYQGPWTSNESAKIGQALQAMTMDHDALQDLVRPPLPQVQLFPPQFGYRTEAIGLDDVVSVDRTYHTRIDFSGTPSGYSGSLRNESESIGFGQ